MTEENKGFWHKTKEITEDAWEETKHAADSVKEKLSKDKKEKGTSCNRGKYYSAENHEMN